MLYKGLPILILGLTLLLSAAAIEFMPETLYFPVVEYATPEKIQIVLLKNGKLTMTLASEDPELALGVCRQTEQQTASLPADQRLRCFPALVAR